MSYDYNALVGSIAKHRRQAAAAASKEEDTLPDLQAAVDAFESLSQHCPMTPLLWMQYAKTASQLIVTALRDTDANQAYSAARQMRIQTLELGISEFPGSCLLQLHYLQLLNDESEDKDKLLTAFETSLEQLGPVHRNEGAWVASIYRLQAKAYVSVGENDKAMETFVQRAKTPMKEANDGILQEVQDFAQENNIEITPSLLERIERGRKWQAKYLRKFETFEDELDVAMHQEHILARLAVGDVPDWDEVLQSGDQQYCMGLGGRETADAFVKYALAFHKYRLHKPDEAEDDEDEDSSLTRQNLSEYTVAVYERGVAECPTVESLWLSYIRCLVDLVQNREPFDSVLQNVTYRAVRNCPYSLALVQQKLQAVLLLANQGKTVFDPDVLMETVEKALDSKFLPGPGSFMDLYLTVIRTVKRRIQFVLSRADVASSRKSGNKAVAYDEAEPLHDKSQSSKEITLSEESKQEIGDLIDDLPDIYDSVESLLRNAHSSWSEGRSVLWKDRAQTEALLLSPLSAALESNAVQSSVESDDVLKSFYKAVSMHSPPHPDTYAVYIQRYIHTVTCKTEREVLVKLRRIRGLYQRAVNSVGKPKAGNSSVPVAATSNRDFETALGSLCQEWIQFETIMGSERSLGRASKAVQKKLLSANAYNKPSLSATAEPANESTTTEQIVQSDEASKRKLTDDSSVERPSKKAKTSTPGEPLVDIEDAERDQLKDSEPTKIGKPTDSKKPSVPKVRIGNLEYPAHPFTVQVSNLNPETVDMDLVDAFRSKCGPIVHARIMREKYHGNSKGWGLVQFEERESVDKALALNDVIGIHEKLVRVERSHQPAAFLVPPGMHRVKPKGEGKSSKQNQKRRERKLSGADVEKEKSEDRDLKPATTMQAKPSKSSKSNELGVLAFRPRGVARGAAHHKVKVSLGGSKDSATTDEHKESHRKGDA